MKSQFSIWTVSPWEAGPAHPTTAVPWPSVPFPSARFRNRRHPLWRSWDWEAFWQDAADINVCLFLHPPATSEKVANASAFVQQPRFIKSAASSVCWNFPAFPYFFPYIQHHLYGQRVTRYWIYPPPFQNILLIFYVFYRMNLLNINRWNLLKISRQDYSTSFLIF